MKAIWNSTFEPARLHARERRQRSIRDSIRESLEIKLAESSKTAINLWKNSSLELALEGALSTEKLKCPFKAIGSTKTGVKYKNRVLCYSCPGFVFGSWFWLVGCFEKVSSKSEMLRFTTALKVSLFPSWNVCCFHFATSSSEALFLAFKNTDFALFSKEDECHLGVCRLDFRCC